MNGIEIVARERGRHRLEHGFTDAKDDTYIHSELALAAACYALPDIMRSHMVSLWPWNYRHWKPAPHDRISELAKAGALIVAEIDRLLRAEQAQQPTTMEESR